ncbi:MAG: hypothetical protein WAM30_02735 [Candidatus Dormiibacterota bacterium]
MRKCLVVANLTAESPALRAEASAIVRQDPDAEFVVLVPIRTIPPSLALGGGLDGRALRSRRAARARARLESVGARQVSVRLGRAEPLAEIERVLREGGFTTVVISTLPRHLSHWLHRDLPGRVARAHPELEVRHVIAPRLLYVDDLSLATSAGAERA